MTVTQTPHAVSQPLGNVQNENASPVNPSIPTSVKNVNPDTKFADPVVLPSTEVLHARMAAFHERMANPPASPTNSAGQQSGQPRMGERQFTGQMDSVPSGE